MAKLGTIYNGDWQPGFYAKFIDEHQTVISEACVRRTLIFIGVSDKFDNYKPALFTTCSSVFDAFGDSRLAARICEFFAAWVDNIFYSERVWAIAVPDGKIDFDKLEECVSDLVKRDIIGDIVMVFNASLNRFEFCDRMMKDHLLSVLFLP